MITEKSSVSLFKVILMEDKKFHPVSLPALNASTEIAYFNDPAMDVFFTMSPDMLCIASDTGYFIRLNQAWEKTLGYSSEELLSKPIVEFIHPDDVEQTVKEFAHELEGHEAFNFVNRYRCKDGSYKWLEWRGKASEDKTKVYAVARDISESKVAKELLWERDSILTAINTSVRDAIIMINNEGNITFWNEASCNIFGYSQEEILGKNLHDLIAPVRFLDEHRKAFHLFKTSGKGAAIGKTLELRAIRKGGQEFPIELSLSAINLKDQWHAVGIIHDISVRKQAESEVRKLSTAIEQSPVSIVITNLEGNIEYANPKACETTGYLLDELVGKNPRVLKSGETKSNEYELLWTSITSGKHWKGIFHNKKKNGELYWESSTIGPITDSNGKITHYLALKEDITERRKVEKALQDSEALLRSFFDLPLIGHAITSLEKGWLEVNASLCNMLGYTKAELLPMTWDELTHPDDLAADVAQFNRVMAGETDGYAIEKRFICRDGHFIDTHMAVQCNRNADLSINYFMAVIVDISDRKKIENQLKQMAEQLSLANEDLVRVNAEKDRFFSIIAHDLRSPFGAFLNLTRLMAEDLNNLSLVKIQKLATTMSKSAAKLYDMLENLLEWSRMQRGITTFEPENMILKNKINSFIQVHCESANDKQININIDVPDNLHVYADERMLQSTIRNLLSNAIKFTPKGGQITIGAVSDRDQPVVVSIRDNGIGMNQKMVDNLFRIDENVSRPGTEGESSSGLELLLCKDFIEKHGGRIWVESEVNKGTVFYFTMPKKSDEQE